MNDDPIHWAIAKLISVWMLIGVTSWTQAASFVAFLYTCILIGEWCWKKIRRKKGKCPEPPPSTIL